MPRPLLFALLIALSPLPAQAHKLIASVYPAGRAVEGEIGFSNGAIAAHQTVQITTPQGRTLGTATTDAAGLFTFTPTEPVTHVFRADLGAGHVAQTQIEGTEVARLMGLPSAPAPATALAVSATSDREALAAMLRDELRPLRQEIAAYRERNDLQSVLGGLGYVAGLFGLAFYLAARRRLGAQP